ncbi:MAG: helicase HerA-like domain-containing protein, partial [Saccharofermentanales bacterium]
MYVDNKIFVAKGDMPVYLLPAMANRHGLIAGATGTGKTTTLKAIAESFSDMGVPVFLADIKGDLASLSIAGSDNPRTL